ncbi:MAG: hypothetical protein M3535_10075, partial [Actinomycetota bacterium]|nr:hypothetical protein [Actinomycetota bacterium]
MSGTGLGTLAAGLVVALALVVRAGGAAARVSLVATRLQGRPPGRAWAGLALSALPAPPDRLVRALA